MDSKARRFIEARLANVAGLVGKYLVLDPVGGRQAIAGVRSRFLREGKLKPELLPWTRRYDISNASGPKAKSILTDNAPPSDPSVFVLWQSERLAITTQLSVFIDYYDDFWHPSSDDVWVVPADLGWALEISHEELIAMVRTDSKGPSRRETIQ